MALDRTHVNFTPMAREKNESITRYTYNYRRKGCAADLTTKREWIYWLYHKVLAHRLVDPMVTCPQGAFTHV